MSNTITIAGRKVGATEPVLVIAEVGQAHDGDFDVAHSYIDAAAGSGVDVVKFQTHIAAAETTLHEQWRVKFSKKDATRYDYWKRMEFSREQWKELKNHAEERKILFMSSPFSLEAVDLLMDIGVPAWKVASGEVCNFPLLTHMASTGMPVLLSSGMSGIDELKSALKCVRDEGAEVGLFQCTSAYPCPPEDIGLNLISSFIDEFNCPVGLSDHSSEIYSSLAAVTLGASMLEFHIAFGKDASYGPDAASSLVPDQIKQLIDGVRCIGRIQAAPVNKDEMVQKLQHLRDLFTKSVVVAEDLAAGTVLEEKHLALKKPGCGIPAKDLVDVVGRCLAVGVGKDHLLAEKDLENGDKR